MLILFQGEFPKITLIPIQDTISKQILCIFTLHTPCGSVPHAGPGFCALCSATTAAPHQSVYYSVLLDRPGSISLISLSYEDMKVFSYMPGRRLHINQMVIRIAVSLTFKQVLYQC